MVNSGASQNRVDKEIRHVPESGIQIGWLGGQDSSSCLVVASWHGKGQEHGAGSSSATSCMSAQGEAASEQVLSVS